MKRFVSLTRYMILFGVLASLLLSAVLFLLGAVQSVLMISDAVYALGEDEVAKKFAIAAVNMADFFLIASGLFIVGVGLYELFIGKLDLPAWLIIESLDDLKEKLISVVVVVLAVTFLSQIANWDGTTNLLPYGASIALVIFALTIFNFLKLTKKTEQATMHATALENIEWQKSRRNVKEKQFISEPHA